MCPACTISTGVESEFSDWWSAQCNFFFINSSQDGSGAYPGNTVHVAGIHPGPRQTNQPISIFWEVEGNLRIQWTTSSGSCGALM